MTFKWIGAIMIIVGGALSGLLLCMSYRHEEQALRQLIAALEYMESELQYRMTPLPELCRQIGKERTGMIGQLFQNLANELETQISPDVHSCLAVAAARLGSIPPKTQYAICRLGESLGRFDLEGQLRGIDSVRCHCRNELEVLISGKDARLRSYQTLGLCAGAALAILLV